MAGGGASCFANSSVVGRECGIYLLSVRHSPSSQRFPCPYRPLRPPSFFTDIHAASLAQAVRPGSGGRCLAHPRKNGILQVAVAVVGRLVRRAVGLGGREQATVAVLVTSQSEIECQFATRAKTGTASGPLKVHWPQPYLLPPHPSSSRPRRRPRLRDHLPPSSTTRPRTRHRPAVVHRTGP